MSVAEEQRKRWIDLVRRHARYTTPFYLTNLHFVYDALDEMKEGLPNVGIYYALKSNDHPRIIQALMDRVDGFDIASKGELDALLRLSVTPEKIIFSNPVKIPAHIRYAYASGVRQFAFDCDDEVVKLAKYAPGSNLHLRIQVPSSGSRFPLSRKFGASADQVLELAELAQSLGLKVNGLTFHVGSQAEDLGVWGTACKVSAACIHALSQNGVDIKFVNIGGGLPVTYGDAVPAIEEVTRAILRAITTYLPSHIKIIAEPGRYLTAASTVLVASVIAQASRHKENWLHLDIGAFQGLIEPLEVKTWKYPVAVVAQNQTTSSKDFVLTGPTCDPHDAIGSHYQLPASVQRGDIICIFNAGAYARVYASKFNGFEIPKNYFV